ncbi:hypothetical protein NSZ01_23060 [Nocardioides szechwanensis]|uniref:hypothetical protein n=1 Tax=Nocardioides szechwanensis TaxID=1005944 RepID=UPI00115FD7A4|nr:hypothetical protein [Nocardioides szechwanensis]GEP34538.1 hypothetical protein NSZ01_23060 [Nocardioides szechwanensis]
MSEPAPPGVPANPPQLLVAASLVAVQGLLLLLFAVLEAASLSSERMSMGLTTSAFFFAYGAALLGCAWALTRQHAWARGPVLLTQLIQLGLAWNLRDRLELSIPMALVALIVVAGMLSPATQDVLADDPMRGRAD